MRQQILLGGALLTLAASEARAQGASSRSVTNSPPTTLVASAAPTPGTTEALLDQLVGDWRMEGHVRGKPVTYTLVACRVLNGRFVELHMTDVQRPPQYEARVFIGADTTPSQVLVHWLDSFGAASSVPHGTGSVVGDTLRFEFAYASGPFRNTFVYDRAAGTWRFLLQSGDGNGGWKPFAEYVVRRVSPPAPPARTADCH